MTANTASPSLSSSRVPDGSCAVIASNSRSPWYPVVTRPTGSSIRGEPSAPGRYRGLATKTAGRPVGNEPRGALITVSPLARARSMASDRTGSMLRSTPTRTLFVSVMGVTRVTT